MTDPQHAPFTKDELTELESATDEERREAEALARALEGGASEPTAPPSDAASMAAFVRAVARDPEADRRVAMVESRVFGGAPAPTNVRRMPTRALASIAIVLASAAAVLLMVRRSEPMMAATPTTTQAPESAQAAAPSAETAPQPLAATATSLLDAERALLEAEGDSREAAFTTLRAALASARDERIGAMLVRHGGAP